MSKLAYTVTAINAVIALAVLLDFVQLTEEQLAGIGVAVNAVAAAVVAWLDPNIPIGNKSV